MAHLHCEYKKRFNYTLYESIQWSVILIESDSTINYSNRNWFNTQYSLQKTNLSLILIDFRRMWLLSYTSWGCPCISSLSAHLHPVRHPPTLMSQVSHPPPSLWSPLQGCFILSFNSPTHWLTSLPLSTAFLPLIHLIKTASVWKSERGFVR